MTSNPFTHLRGNGSAHMVDVTTKTPTVRVATAECCVVCSEPIMTALRDESVPKGDVLAVARIAGIQATKHTQTSSPWRTASVCTGQKWTCGWSLTG